MKELELLISIDIWLVVLYDVGYWESRYVFVDGNYVFLIMLLLN